MKLLLSHVLLPALIFDVTMAMSALVSSASTVVTKQQGPPEILKREAAANGFYMDIDLGRTTQSGLRVSPAFLDEVLVYSEQPITFVRRTTTNTAVDHERASISVKSTLTNVREDSVSIWDEETRTSRPQNVLSYESGAYSLHGSL